MYAVKILLEATHIGSEVLHLRVDGKGKVLNQAIEVIHLGLYAFKSLSQDQAEVCLVLGYFNNLVIHICWHLLLFVLEAVS